MDAFSQEVITEITEHNHDLFLVENLLVFYLHENIFGAYIKKTIISSEISPQQCSNLQTDEIGNNHKVENM